MQLTKRTYALPKETMEQFERVVARGQRSSTLARLISGWLGEKQRAELARQIVDGCHEMSEIYVAVERDYHPLEEEVEGSFGDSSQAR